MTSGLHRDDPRTPVRPNLSALAARLPSAPITRFAPSPTGYLHLGHVVNAIYVWGLARALGGRVLLRIEDHDRARSRPEYEAAILGDLTWLGLEPDIGRPHELGAPSPFRQSDNDARYRCAFGQLRLAAHTYVCRCSRKRIAERVFPPHDTEPRYPGTCRALGYDEGPEGGLRVQLDPGVEQFDDALLGAQAQDPSAQCGDLLVRDRFGFWTYQFSVVVDDSAHEIDLVIRGRDLLASTGRQIRLARLLGRTCPPVFLHHPLLLKRAGEKLSKSNGDSGVRELRESGHAASDVLGLAAWLCGLLASPAPVTARELPTLFPS